MIHGIHVAHLLIERLPVSLRSVPASPHFPPLPQPDSFPRSTSRQLSCPNRGISELRRSRHCGFVLSIHASQLKICVSIHRRATTMAGFRYAFSISTEEVQSAAPPGTITLVGKALGPFQLTAMLKKSQITHFNELSVAAMSPKMRFAWFPSHPPIQQIH